MTARKIPGSVPTNRRDEALKERPMSQKAREHAFLDWKKDSACFHSDEVTTADFYFDDNRFGKDKAGMKERYDHIRKLRRICAFCPVLEPCTELGKVEPFGFLAGKTEEERATEKSSAKKRAYIERKRLGLVKPQVQARSKPQE